MATTTIGILMIYVVLSLGGSMAPSPSYPVYPGGRRIDKEVPNPAMDRTQISGTPIPRCHGDDYCENVSNYPSDAIRRALRTNNSFSTFFKRKRPVIDRPPQPQGEGRLGTIYGDDPYEERVCDILEQVITPKVATNKNKEKKFIVNDGQDYRQFVKIEKCRKGNDSCQGVEGHLSRGHTTICRQKHFLKLLLYYDEEVNHLEVEEFEFPLACVCFIVRRSPRA